MGVDMKALILSDKAIKEIILSLRTTGPNRKSKDREYVWQLTVKLMKQLGPEPWRVKK